MARFERKRDGTGTKTVAKVLEAVLVQNRLNRGLGRAKVLSAWAEVAGEQLLRSTRAKELRGDGVLVIETQDAVAANFLSMQSPMFLERFRAVLGDATPAGLRFQMGVFEAPKPSKRQRSRLGAVALPPIERQRLTGLLEEASEGVLPAARKAAEAMIRARLERQALGWQACVVCGMLTEPEAPSLKEAPSAPRPCHHCRNTLSNPHVQRAAKQFVRNPDLALGPSDQLYPGATDDAKACARFLALTHLQEQLELLLPQVIKPKGRGRKRPNAPEAGVLDLRLQLEFLARNFLGLHLAKLLPDLTDRDRQHLPERVRHVLEALQED